MSEAVEAKWKEANKCFTQPMIVKVYSSVQTLIQKYLKVRKFGKAVKRNELKQTAFFKKCDGTLLNLLACK